MVHDKVIAFLRDNGPSLPVEISTRVGYDSFVMRAVLYELINKGLVKKSKRPIGGSLIYYLPEQLSEMRKKLYDDLSIAEKKVLKYLKEEGQVLLSQLSPHQRAFIKKLMDFVLIKKQEDDYLITYYSYNGKPSKSFDSNQSSKSFDSDQSSKSFDSDQSSKSFDSDQKPVPEESPEPPEIKPLNNGRLFVNTSKKEVTKENFKGLVDNFIKGLGEVKKSKKVRVDREYNYELLISQPFPQELFIKAKRKKTLTERDLSLAYTEALRVKKPCLLVTNGKLSKKAKKWKKDNVGSLVKVVRLK